MLPKGHFITNGILQKEKKMLLYGQFALNKTFHVTVRVKVWVPILVCELGKFLPEGKVSHSEVVEMGRGLVKFYLWTHLSHTFYFVDY